jgi:hypothetical protein
MKSSKQNAEAEEDIETAHLQEIEDGCGCVEVWENLSDYRDAGE